MQMTFCTLIKHLTRQAPVSVLSIGERDDLFMTMETSGALRMLHVREECVGRL